MEKVKDFVRERDISGYKIVLPEPPAPTKIANYHLPQEKQKFIRTEVPKDFKSWTPEARREFIATEWDRRLNGFWFYNNGRIEYITGTHYFYINWWRINTGFPMFIDCDRDFFYVWKHCEDDPLCDGLVYITHRGEGKTFKATCILYDPTSRKENIQAGIQSKTEPDARKIYNKLIYSWSKLPYFFRPIDIGVTRPAKVLEFSEPSKRDTKSQDKANSDVLNSFIDFQSSGVAAYDGQNLHRIFHDEIGKTIECDVDERMATVRECLRAGRGKYGRGKILATTTVEEMLKKGGANCKKVWEKANPNKLDANGFTKNGLYRMFKPSDYGYLEIINGESFVDDYGYSLREKTKQYFLNKRAALKGADLNSEKRKFPLEEEDIWVSDSRKSVYDTQKIDQQLRHNETLPDNILVRGNFYWKDGKDSTVSWSPREDGKWLISWLPRIEDRNKFTLKGGKRVPGNTEQGNFGLDPYDNDSTVDDRKSDAASYGYRKFDPMSPTESGIFISEYVNRPPQADIMFEDMIMQSVFYGWENLIESNKIGCIQYFKRRGYEHYLMSRPDETQTTSSAKMLEPGIPMSGREARQALIYATESFIVNKVGLIEEEGVEPYMGKCYFKKLLDNWGSFDFDDEWTKYDSMVGAGLALLGGRKYVARKREYKEDLMLFQKFKIQGTSSVEMRPNEQVTNNSVQDRSRMDRYQPKPNK